MNNKHTLISTSKLQMAGAHLLEIGDYSCYPPSSIIKEDNNMKHTKGKWEVKESDGVLTIVCTDLNGRKYYIADVNGDSDFEPTYRANASLIASAPEMLKVLKAVNKYNWDCNQGRFDDLHKKTMRFGGLWNLVETTLKKLNAYETYPEAEGGE